MESAIARGIAYAPYADLIWCETSHPDLEEARRFAEAVHAEYPGKMLAYNCSPSFNWKKNLDDRTIATFQRELAKMGYKFQFVTLAGFHALNLSMFELARGYKDSGMTAYSRLQEKEFARETQYGYEAVKHQRFVGTGYFDALTQVIAAGTASTTALEGSTEQEQFVGIKPQAATQTWPECGLPADPGRVPLRYPGDHADGGVAHAFGRLNPNNRRQPISLYGAPGLEHSGPGAFLRSLFNLSDLRQPVALIGEGCLPSRPHFVECTPPHTRSFETV